MKRVENNLTDYALILLCVALVAVAASGVLGAALANAHILSPVTR